MDNSKNATAGALVPCLALEVTCPECTGRGAVDGDTCSQCAGTHYVPTDLGEAVLDLVRRHLRIGVAI